VETTINEKIRVVSLFEKGELKPLLFSWCNRNYKILRTVFTYCKASSSAYSKDLGREKVFYFSVDTGGGVFELSFNREKFSWSIEKVF